MRLILIVAGIMAGMYGIDMFFAAQERNELQQDATRQFAAGERLLRAGKAREAKQYFSRAHALERSNMDYENALAAAELASGDTVQARSTLGEVLLDDSNNARANLLMARAMAAERRFPEADSYYHRAIYGSWPPHSERERAKTRMELANLLASLGAKEELLSELLLLQNEPPADPDWEARIAGLFLQAGTASRAADAYRILIQRHPDEAAGFVGLAKAEMLRGNYAAARAAYRTASRLDPSDDSLRREDELVARLAILDPTPRRLSTSEKYERSLDILTMVEDELRACSPAAAPPVNPPARPKVITNELSEALLENAERLWKARSDSCKQPPEPFDPLPVLMTKLSQ